MLITPQSSSSTHVLRYQPAKYQPPLYSSRALGHTHISNNNQTPPASMPPEPDLQRIIRLIYAFHGDIFGEVLLQTAAFTSYQSCVDGRKPLCAPRDTHEDDVHVRCRISPEQSILFLSILRVDYVVERVDATGSYRISSQPSASASASSAESRRCVNLHLCLSSRRDWCLSASDFDVDMLAMDTHRLYVRSGAPSRLPQANAWAASDPFSYLLSRLRARRFSLVDAGRTLLINQRAMRRAHVLLKNGWIMDDAMLGDRGWLMSAYSRVGEHRKYVPPGEQQHDTCALCLDAFKDDDLVVHLCCGHTFHYTCPGGSVDAEQHDRGLSAWLHAGAPATLVAGAESSDASDAGGGGGGGGHNTCPYCRAII